MHGLSSCLVNSCPKGRQLYAQMCTHKELTLTVINRQDEDSSRTPNCPKMPDVKMAAGEAAGSDSRENQLGTDCNIRAWIGFETIAAHLQREFIVQL